LLIYSFIYLINYLSNLLNYSFVKFLNEKQQMPYVSHLILSDDMTLLKEKLDKQVPTGLIVVNGGCTHIRIRIQVYIQVHILIQIFKDYYSRMSYAKYHILLVQRLYYPHVIKLFLVINHQTNIQ